MQFSTSLRNSRLASVAAAIGPGGKLRVYTGPPPGVGNPATGTLLATLTDVTLGTPSGGVAAVSATPDGSAAATGTPGYYRILTSGDVVLVEGPAGVGAGELAFDRAISLNGQVSLPSGTLTEGNA